MYLFPRHKLAFFHIPKTGGQSVSAFLIDALRQRGDLEQEIQKTLWHEPLTDKIGVLGRARFDELTVLTVVRNPFAMVVSLKFWYEKKVAERHPDWNDPRYPETVAVAGMTFAEYMSWWSEHVPSIGDYLLVDAEIPRNVRCLRLEHLDRDLDAALNDERSLGIDVEVPVIGTSSHGPFMSYLDDRFRRMVREKERFAFERFYSSELEEPH